MSIRLCFKNLLYLRPQILQLLLFSIGMLLICFGLHSQVWAQGNEPAFNDERIQEAFGLLLTYLEGSFGALIMVVAGVFSIISAAFGQYKAALSCLVIGVGAFILRSFISSFFNIDVDLADGYDSTF